MITEIASSNNKQKTLTLEREKYKDRKHKTYTIKKEYEF